MDWLLTKYQTQMVGHISPFLKRDPFCVLCMLSFSSMPIRFHRKKYDKQNTRAKPFAHYISTQQAIQYSDW